MIRSIERTSRVWVRVAVLFLVIVGSLALVTAVTLAAQSSPVVESEAAVASPDCVDFESLPLSGEYVVGDVFVDSGVIMRALPFEWSNGTVYTGGIASIGNTGFAGGTGREIQLNNINLAFDFGQPLNGLSILFGEYGGNLNLMVNGVFTNFLNFADLNGQVIGDVTFFVINGLGNDTGYLRMAGPIAEFSVGGQELWIDDACPETNCVDFEDLVPGTSYVVNDVFVDSGVPVTVRPFEFTGGGVFTNGTATVSNAGLAGGSGLDMNANNVNLVFQFAYPLKGLSFDFGEYGGNVNLMVNGVFTNVLNFSNLHTAMMGGVRVIVVGGPIGRVYLFGEVSEFAVGGQELWIDNVCPESCCVDFESLPPMASYNVGDAFMDSGAHMALFPFEWSGGTVYTGGVATADSSGLSGGSGQDMHLNNINMAVDFGMPVSHLSLLFGEYGGNLNLEVNGVFTNFTIFADLDGTMLGGTAVSVVNGFGNDRGKLAFDGVIFSFKIGGQELWVDDICAVRMDKRLFLPIILKPELE